MQLLTPGNHTITRSSLEFLLGFQAQYHMNYHFWMLYYTERQAHLLSESLALETEMWM